MSNARQVLVVDDESAVRMLVRFHLEQEGYAVSEAGDADRALELVRRSPPALVVLDVHMPHKDGWAVLAAMREDPVLAAVPVVMLTADADESTEWRARDLGAVAFVSKPVSMDDLTRVIGNVLRPL